MELLRGSCNPPSMTTVVFACVHNAGRSQMAAAWFNELADPAKARAISAGTEPGERVHPEVLAAMREVGIDLSAAKPELLTETMLADAHRLVTMGCGEACPVVPPSVVRDDWPFEDPKGKPLERVRAIRDDIRERVRALVREQGWERRGQKHSELSDSTDERGLPLWPAAERNKQAIAEVLAVVLPAQGLLLEIASGSGQHAEHFVGALPRWKIQPSDFDSENLETLRRRVALAKDPRLLPPLELDVTMPPPRLEPTAIYCANMVHIAPWSACIGLFRVASELLPPTGLLVTYGPYSVHGKHTAESNVRFDQSLRERNVEWGVRDVDELEDVAKSRGLALVQTHSMPANNLLLVWHRK